MEWQRDNTMDIGQLRAALRRKQGPRISCAVVGCENRATDVHHLDHNHANNAPHNLAPACKLCHNEVHGISAEMSDLKLLTRLYYSAQDQRKAAANRVRAYKALGIEVHYAEQALRDAQDFEKRLAGHIEALLEGNDFYNAWLRHVKGIGPLLSASLLSELGSPDRFDSVSAQWAYCGLHVNGDGEAPRRSKGNHANWNPQLRMTAWKVASQFVKQPGSFGRLLYDGYRAYYEKRDGAEPKWKPHARAMRRVAKDFLRCLWVEWRRAEGLALSEAHPNTWPLPEDWLHAAASPRGTCIPHPQ